MRIPESLKHTQILIVDDVTSMRSLLKATLRDFGFLMISEAEDGNQAINKIKQRPFDLIICDLAMPGLSGLEVLKEVRSNPKTNQLPFIMLTGSAGINNVKEAIAAGVNAYLVKPIQANTAFSKIVQVLEKSDTL